MAGALSAGLPAPLPPWQAMHGANSCAPSAANEAALHISNRAPSHGARPMLRARRPDGTSRSFHCRVAAAPAEAMSMDRDGLERIRVNVPVRIDLPRSVIPDLSVDCNKGTDEVAGLQLTGCRTLTAFQIRRGAGPGSSVSAAGHPGAVGMNGCS